VAKQLDRGVAFSQDGGQRPDIIAAPPAPTQTWCSASPGCWTWNTAARGRIDLDRIRRHWPEILRVIASIYTGAVRAYDVVRMLQRDGNPTPLGEAIASYGRISRACIS